MRRQPPAKNVRNVNLQNQVTPRLSDAMVFDSVTLICICCRHPVLSLDLCVREADAGLVMLTRAKNPPIIFALHHRPYRCEPLANLEYFAFYYHRGALLNGSHVSHIQRSRHASKKPEIFPCARGHTYCSAHVEYQGHSASMRISHPAAVGRGHLQLKYGSDIRRTRCSQNPDVLH